MGDTLEEEDIPMEFVLVVRCHLAASLGGMMIGREMKICRVFGSGCKSQMGRSQMGRSRMGRSQEGRSHWRRNRCWGRHLTDTWRRVRPCVSFVDDDELGQCQLRGKYGR